MKVGMYIALRLFLAVFQNLSEPNFDWDFMILERICKLKISLNLIAVSLRLL